MAGTTRYFSQVPLAVAGGLTLLLAPMVVGNLHPWGTRGALSTVQWLVFCPPRWLCMALALSAGLRAGLFQWVSSRAELRWLVVMGAHVGIGLASLFCLVELSETEPPTPWWLRTLSVLIALVVPAVLIFFLAMPTQQRSPFWRAVLVGCVAIAAMTGTTVAWTEHLSNQALQHADAARAVERAAQERAILARLDSLAPDAPLESWLPFTAVVGMPTVLLRVQDTIRARPHLTFDLVGCLRRDDAPTRALVLDFVRDGGLPALPVESIPEARESLAAEVAAMRTRVETQPDVAAVAFDPECLEAVFLVARYPGHERAFVTTLREMRAVLDPLPRAEPLPAGQDELERWLRLNDPDKPR